MRCLTQSYHLTAIFYEALSEELRQHDNRLISAIAGLQVCPWGCPFSFLPLTNLPLSCLCPAIFFRPGYSHGGLGVAQHYSNFTKHKRIVCVWTLLNLHLSTMLHKHTLKLNVTLGQNARKNAHAPLTSHGKRRRVFL